MNSNTETFILLQNVPAAVTLQQEKETPQDKESSDSDSDEYFSCEDGEDEDEEEEQDDDDPGQHRCAKQPAPEVQPHLGISPAWDKAVRESAEDHPDLDGICDFCARKHEGRCKADVDDTLLQAAGFEVNSCPYPLCRLPGHG